MDETREPLEILRARVSAEIASRGGHDSGPFWSEREMLREVLEWIDEFLPPRPQSCPFCQCDNAVLAPAVRGFAVACMNPPCSTLGPMKATEAAALEAWNRRA